MRDRACGRDSIAQSVSWLGYGIRIPAEKIFFFPKFSNRLLGPTSLQFNGNRSFILGVIRPGRELFSHLHVMRRLRTCGAIPPLPYSNSLYEHGERYVLCDQTRYLWHVVQMSPIGLKLRCSPSCSTSIHNAAISNPFMAGFLLNIHQLARYFV
jgi:hypothetical protein